MKQLLTYLLALFALCASAVAQAPNSTPSMLDEYMETGMEVDGVRAPYYDEDGTLKAQLYGGHAKVLEDGVADVANLRIDVFEGNKVIMTMFAPQCFTKMEEVDGKKSLTVTSDGFVLIDMDEMTIFGRGFHFSSIDNRFEILHDSKVLVKESTRAKGKVDL